MVMVVTELLVALVIDFHRGTRRDKGTALGDEDGVVRG